MKKVISLLLVGTMAGMMLAGCGSTAKEAATEAPKETTAAPAATGEKSGDTSTAETSEAAAQGEKTYRVANLVKQLGTAWYQRQQLGLDVMNKEGGVDCFMVGPETADAALQVKIMEDLIAQGVDAITVVPVSVEALEPVCKKAREAGIIVISHEAAGMENVDYDVEAFDNAAYGTYMMDLLAESMGKKGEYATTVGFLTSKSHNEWMDAAVARQKEAYPDMTLVADKIEENDNSQTGYDKFQELVKTYPDLSGILVSSMSGTQGVGLAIEEMGLAGKVNAVGTCIVSVSGPYLESGALTTTTFWDPAGAGYALNKVALMALRGEEIKTGTDLGYTGYESITLNGNVVYGSDTLSATKENMADYPF